MKNHIFSIILAAVCCAFAACNQNEPTDTKKGGDTPTSQHQPSDPATWSPAGKRYAYTYEDEGTHEVLEFVSKDSIYIYDTPNSDYTFNEGVNPATNMGYNFSKSHYSIEYPNLFIGTSRREMTFNDTTSIYYPAWTTHGITYTLKD